MNGDFMIDATAKAFVDDNPDVLLRAAIFTKPKHIEKIVNFLNAKLPELRYFITTDKQEIKNFAHSFDVGISYCCPFILDVDERPFYNYHPALLSKYKGVNIYADAIGNGERMWGVTLHRMTNKVDEGELIDFERFPIDIPYSTNEIGTAAHFYLFRLFRRTIKQLMMPDEL